MRKIMFFALACLVWLGSWSAGPAKAVDEFVTKRGRLAPGFYVTIQGKLAALPTPAWLQEFGVGYVIQADGQQLFVSFEKDKKLPELASKLSGKLIRLNGMLTLVDDPRIKKEGDPIFPERPKIMVVRASGLEKVEDPNTKEEVSITAVGTLHPQMMQLAIAGPPRLWEIAAGKQDLPFIALDKELLETLVKLEGNEVMATGTLKNGAFVVKTITISL